MQRVTKRNSNGQYYMDGDGIFSDWGTPEKFMGDDVDTIGAIEDILGDDYDFDRLKVIVNQRMTMREEVAERFRITKDVPVERLKELVEADRDGRWSENGWRGQMTEKDLEIQELRQRQVKIFKAAEELKKTMDNLCDFCKSAAEASTKHCTPACGHCYIIKAYKNLEDLTEK